MYVELIPQIRRERLWRRRCIRRWSAVLGGSTIVAIGALVLTTSRIGPVEPLHAHVASLTAELTAQRNAEAVTRNDLTRAVSTLQANRAVADQVDWSRVLAIVAQAAGDDVRLGRCQLSTSDSGFEPERRGRASSRRRRHDQRTTGIRLGVAGYGRSSQSVSGFVLALEETGLFDQVRLLDSRREPFDAGHAIAFRLECVVTDEEEGADS